MQQDFFLPEATIFAHSRTQLERVLEEVLALLQLPEESLVCFPRRKDWVEFPLACDLLPSNALSLIDDHVSLLNIEALLTKYHLHLDHVFRSKRKLQLVYLPFIGSENVRMVKLECSDANVVDHLKFEF